MSFYIKALFYIDHLEHFKCFLGFFQLSGLCVYKSQSNYSSNIYLIVCKVFFYSLIFKFIICKFLLKKAPEIFFKGGNIFDPFFKCKINNGPLASFSIPYYVVQTLAKQKFPFSRNLCLF